MKFKDLIALNFLSLFIFIVCVIRQSFDLLFMADLIIAMCGALVASLMLLFKSKLK